MCLGLGGNLLGELESRSNDGTLQRFFDADEGHTPPIVELTRQVNLWMGIVTWTQPWPSTLDVRFCRGLSDAVLEPHLLTIPIEWIEGKGRLPTFFFAREGGAPPQPDAATQDALNNLNFDMYTRAAQNGFEIPNLLGLMYTMDELSKPNKNELRGPNPNAKAEVLKALKSSYKAIHGTEYNQNLPNGLDFILQPYAKSHDHTQLVAYDDRLLYSVGLDYDNKPPQVCRTGAGAPARGDLLWKSAGSIPSWLRDDLLSFKNSDTPRGNLCPRGFESPY